MLSFVAYSLVLCSEIHLVNYRRYLVVLNIIDYFTEVLLRFMGLAGESHVAFQLLYEVRIQQ